MNYINKIILIIIILLLLFLFMRDINANQQNGNQQNGNTYNGNPYNGNQQNGNTYNGNENNNRKQFFSGEVNNNLSAIESRDVLHLDRQPNGRVNILDSDISPYPFFLEKENNYNFSEHAVTAIYDLNDLQKQFFADKNINYLQKKIKQKVNKKSNKKYTISDQDLKILKIIMKSIYLQYGKNLKNDVCSQVKILNELVINYCVKNIMSNVELYLTYKKRVSFSPIPLSRPKYISNAGTKTNENFVF